jgi:predicted amidohydrolase
VSRIATALIQFDVRFGDPRENRRRMGERLEALPGETRLVLLPELWSCSYDNPRLADHARESERCLDVVREWCSARGAFALAGSLPWAEEGGLFNRSWLVNDAGDPFAFYDKVHLFPLLEEPLRFCAGSSPTLADLPGFRAGVAICYDLRFPEYLRCLALAGAELLLLCAEWPRARIEAWRVLLRARAIENQQYVLGCNRCGEGYGGHSLAVAPDGTILAEAGEEEEALMVGLEPSSVRRTRSALPVFEDRRPELYGPIVAFGRRPDPAQQ